MNEREGLKSAIDRALAKEVLAGARLWYLKVAGGPYQRTGVPDYLLCVDGTFAGLELKHPDRPVTEDRWAMLAPKQAVEARKIVRAGGAIEVVTRVDDAMQFVMSLRR